MKKIAIKLLVILGYFSVIIFSGILSLKLLVRILNENFEMHQMTSLLLIALGFLLVFKFSLDYANKLINKYC